MSLKQSFDIHIGTHLESLKTLRNGMPPGVPDQFGEVATILAEYDVAVAKIQDDKNLSAQGRTVRLKAAHDEAMAAVERWKTGKTTGIDAQTTAKRAALQAQVDKLLPTPSDLQVQTMGQRLAGFDPLEVETLYADATDAERRVIEVAAEAIGRQPRRVSLPGGEQVVWEHLLAPERVAAVRAARLEQVNPEGAAALQDLQHIRTTYDTLASTAAGLLHDSLASRAETVPVG
jgi:hypothetical protein